MPSLSERSDASNPVRPADREDGRIAASPRESANTRAKERGRRRWGVPDTNDCAVHGPGDDAVPEIARELVACTGRRLLTPRARSADVDGPRKPLMGPGERPVASWLHSLPRPQLLPAGKSPASPAASTGPPAGSASAPPRDATATTPPSSTASPPRITGSAPSPSTGNASSTAEPTPHDPLTGYARHGLTERLPPPGSHLIQRNPAHLCIS